MALQANQIPAGAPERGSRQAARAGKTARARRGARNAAAQGAAGRHRLAYGRVAAIARPAAADEVMNLRLLAMTALTAWTVLLAGFMTCLLADM